MFTSIVIGTIALDQECVDMIAPLIIKSFFLFGTVQSIDNFLIHPTIYSKAFNVHPLEVFFVALSAGLIGGILWMIIAIPVYAIFRIILLELLTNIEKS